MKWNEAQERAIFTRDQNILVSAAAGSGKTAVLTERIRQLVVTEKVPIDEMLIVTFTNAAAAEMRERIRRGLEDAMEEETADPAALQEQLDRLGEADICTFDSFCLKVIRTYFYCTDVTPDFAICDEAQREIFQQEALEQMMGEFFHREDPKVLDFLKRYADARSDDNVMKMVTAASQFMGSLAEPEQWLADSLERIRTSEDERERATLPAAEVLSDMILRYQEILTEKKKGAGQLDFTDIEHLALSILKLPEPARELQEQYRYIFIDEYQDTNELQDALIRCISRTNNRFLVGDVKQCIYRFRLADPEIFIRQYRQLRSGTDPNSIKIDLNRNFRSKPPVLAAANEVMEAIMTEETGGIAYDEDARLVPGMTFDPKLSAQYPAPPVQVDIIDAKQVPEDLRARGWTEPEWKSAELEALFACRRIREVLGQEYYDAKSGEIRQITYRDIAVLMRAYRGSAEVWQEVFRREGIPAYVAGDDEYFDTVEILVFTNLLKLLVNRRQDIPLLSVLKSVIFDFTVSDIARIRIHRREGLFAEAFLSYADEGTEEDLREKCFRARSRIDRWSQESGYLSLKDLLWKVAEESGYYDFVGGLPRGARRQANLRDLIRQAEKFQKDSGQNLAGFLKYIDRIAKTSTAVPSRAPASGEDVVEVMSIHKSKGLEFPVVILAGAGKLFNHRKTSEELSLDRHFGLALRYRSPGNEYHIKTATQLRIDEDVKAKEVAEEMRLLYVAMTRARERLFLIGSVKNTEKNPLPGADKNLEECTSFLDWVGYASGGTLETEFRRIQVHQTFPWDIELSEEKEEEVPTDGLEESPVTPFEESGTQLSLFGLIEAQEDGSTPSSEEEERRQLRGRLQFRYPHLAATRVPAKFTATELNRYHMELPEEEAAWFGTELTGLADPQVPSAPRSSEEMTSAPEAYKQGASEQGGSTVSTSMPGASPAASSDIPGLRIPALRQTLPTYASAAGDLTAAEKGILTHRVLQEMDITRTESLPAVEAQIREMVQDGQLTEREAAGVNAGWILRFFQSPLGRRMKASSRVHREQEFLLWEPFDQDTGSIVQGIIDCFFEEEGGFVLIDYKTDYIPRVDGQWQWQDKAEQYRRQIEIYRKAIETATGKPVRESCLYFLSIGESVELK